MDELKEELLARPKYKWEVAESVADCEAVIQENWQAIQLWQKSHKPIIVMCPPDYYAVDRGNTTGDAIAGNGFVKDGFIAFEKNPQQNRRQMLQEWYKLRDLVISKGATVIQMTPKPSFPDQVFTADHSFSCVYVKKEGDSLLEDHSTTIISQLAHPNRVNEAAEVIGFFDMLQNDNAYADLFNQRDILIATGKFEGTGDNLLDPYRGIILSGYGYRNNLDTLKQFETIMKIPVFPIENKTPFFHIDTYVSILPGGYVLYAPSVMNETAITALEQAVFKGHDALKNKYAIHVSKEDAYAFCCNAVILGNEILMQPCSESLDRALISKGISVTHLNAKIANYAGGSLHCMTNMINQPIFVNQKLTLTQSIFNDIKMKKPKSTSLNDLSHQFGIKIDEIDSIYDEVEKISNDPSLRNSDRQDTSTFKFISTIALAV